MKLILTIFLVTTAACTYAQTGPAVSKKVYNLFNPTPKSMMRDFETDRPDVTESAYTVDAGHFQFETDLFKTEHFKTSGITTINNYFNAPNIKMGITNSLDLQLVINSLEVSTL